MRGEKVKQFRSKILHCFALFLGAGSAKCSERKACTVNDYIELHSSCDQNNKVRQLLNILFVNNIDNFPRIEIKLYACIVCICNLTRHCSCIVCISVHVT